MLLQSMMMTEKWRKEFISFGDISELQIVPNIYHFQNGIPYKVSAIPSTVIVIPRDRNSMKHVIRNYRNWSDHYACIMVDHKRFLDFLLIQCTPGYNKYLQDMGELKKIIPDADDAKSIIEQLLANGDFNCMVMYPLQMHNPSLSDLPKTHWVVEAMSRNEEVFGLTVGGFGYLQYNDCKVDPPTKRLKISKGDISIQLDSTFSNESGSYEESEEGSNEDEEGSDEEEGGSDEEEEGSDEEEGGSDEEEEGSDEESKSEEEDQEEDEEQDEEQDDEEDEVNHISDEDEDSES